MSFFPCGSWESAVSADSVHPFRTRIFPSSWESNRLCREANPPEMFVPAPREAGTHFLTANPVQTHHILSRHPSGIHSIAPAVFPERHRALGAVTARLGDLEDSTSPQARTGSGHPGISSGSCSPALRAAASFTACSHSRVWYLIPDDTTRISRWHLLSVRVRNVSPPAPRAAGPAESVRRAVTQPPAPQGRMAK